MSVVLEVPKVVGSFPVYSCSLLIEYSNHSAEVTWTGPHLLCGSTVLVMFMLKSDNCCANKSCCSPLRLFCYLMKLEFVGISVLTVLTEQYCTCHFSFVFIEGPKHAILLQKRQSFLFVLPLP